MFIIFSMDPIIIVSSRKEAAKAGEQITLYSEKPYIALDGKITTDKQVTFSGHGSETHFGLPFADSPDEEGFTPEELYRLLTFPNGMLTLPPSVDTLAISGCGAGLFSKAPSYLAKLAYLFATGDEKFQHIKIKGVTYDAHLQPSGITMVQNAESLKYYVYTSEQYEFRIDYDSKVNLLNQRIGELEFRQKESGSLLPAEVTELEHLKSERGKIFETHYEKSPHGFPKEIPSQMVLITPYDYHLQQSLLILKNLTQSRLHILLKPKDQKEAKSPEFLAELQSSDLAIQKIKAEVAQLRQKATDYLALKSPEAKSSVETKAASPPTLSEAERAQPKPTKVIAPPGSITEALPAAPQETTPVEVKEDPLNTSKPPHA